MGWDGNVKGWRMERRKKEGKKKNEKKEKKKGGDMRMRMRCDEVR